MSDSGEVDNLLLHGGVKNQSTSVFYASVQLLTMNFFRTLAKGLGRKDQMQQNLYKKIPRARWAPRGDILAV